MKSIQEDKRVVRIRARSSYLLFEHLYDFLNKEPTVSDILGKFHDVLDAKSAFGSRRNAECAAESLELVLRDNGEVDDGPLKQKWPEEQI